MSKILGLDPKDANNEAKKRCNFWHNIFGKFKKKATKAETPKPTDVFAEEVVQSVDQTDGEQQNVNSLNLETKSESLVLISERKSKDWNQIADNVIREALKRMAKSKDLTREIVSEMKRRCGTLFDPRVWNCVVGSDNFGATLSDVDYALFEAQDLQIVVYKQSEDHKSSDSELLRSVSI